MDVSKCAVLELSAECVQMKFGMKQISGKLKLVDGRYILRCNSPWWHIDTSNIYECSSKSSQPTTCIVFGWALISWHFPFHSLNNSRHFWDELNLEFDMYNFNTNKKFRSVVPFVLNYSTHSTKCWNYSKNGNFISREVWKCNILNKLPENN